VALSNALIRAGNARKITCCSVSFATRGPSIYTWELRPTMLFLSASIPLRLWHRAVASQIRCLGLVICCSCCCISGL